MVPGILLITGDFNFHVDCHSDRDAKNFSPKFGLQQHVQVPTYLTGHTLNLIITRSNNDITVSSSKASVALSDYFFIECNLNIPRPSPTVKETVYRKHKTLDLHVFKTDITESLLCTSTWNNVSELALCYENTLTSLLEKHAPLQRKDDSPRSLANDFGAFFIRKIELIQQDIDRIVVNQPEVQVQHTHARLENFSKLTEDNVQRIIMSSSNATCILDLIPTWLVKSCSEVLTPVITQMLNFSLLEGHVPTSWKNAVVKPMLKKSGIEPILKNYRPVSNLPFVAKATEKAVINQFMDYCTINHLLLPDNQSSYRKYHSTETALVKVHNDILTSMDRQEITFLILLDLSAAFDTINHSLMIDILKNDFGIAGVVKKWFESYLVSRQQRILIKQHLSISS